MVIKNLLVAFEKNKEYTALKIDEIAHSILANLPPDYSLEEINEYRKDYLKALDKGEKKNSRKRKICGTPFWIFLPMARIKVPPKVSC